MAKSHADRIQDEVNRRMSAMAASAGVSRSRIELEVLFLLPPEFVRMYQELFQHALADPVTAGDGGKDEGRVKAAGKPRDSMRARSMAGAKSGKRFVAGHWPIRSEEAIEAKRKLDRSLVKAADKALRDARIRAAEVNGETAPASMAKCATCGRFQKIDWLRCPYHE